ncbi:hypothetical protein TrCOL_g320 [Triparma columacea]|uniref:Uncharacterized protein n=1 Tax=Triparma columacea TaxID=722753 RepID=A0A9W7LDY8_9STRA|nr:hypothetical protein TrCOL_g320 [Triparma columacea]
MDTDIVLYTDSSCGETVPQPQLGVWLEGRLYELEREEEEEEEEEEEGETKLVPVEGSKGVDGSNVRLMGVLDHSLFELSARQINGGQGLGNPHGEHCEDVFIVGREALKEEIGRLMMARS